MLRVREKKVSFMYISNNMYIHAYYIYTYTLISNDIYICIIMYVCVCLYYSAYYSDVLLETFVQPHQTDGPARGRRFGDPPAVCAGSTGLRC